MDDSKEPIHIVALIYSDPGKSQYDDKGTFTNIISTHTTDNTGLVQDVQ